MVRPYKLLFFEIHQYLYYLNQKNIWHGHKTKLYKGTLSRLHFLFSLYILLA